MTKLDSEYRYLPEHPNANIHGMIEADGSPTCITRNLGIRCTGCCAFPIPKFNPNLDPDIYITGIAPQDGIRLDKQPGNTCIAHIPRKGCDYVFKSHKEKRYWLCPMYHCSGDRATSKDESKQPDVRLTAHQRLLLANLNSFSLGEITREESTTNIIKHIGSQPMQITFEEEDLYTPGED